MITAVVLVHNDEKIIESCLKSLAWCDEIVVVDDDSTDKTTEIAKKNNVKVFTRSLNDDFAAQRNFGLSKATNEWVLFVDSDEIVTAELANEIQQEKEHNSYFIKRIDTMWGRELKYGETANAKLLRLAKKNAGKWIRPVHETWNINGDAGELKHPLLHYPHQNVAQFIEEINYYSTLNAKVFYDSGVRTGFVQIFSYPLAKFFINYLLRRGFLDGVPGTLVAILMSFHSFLTRAKLWQMS